VSKLLPKLSLAGLIFFLSALVIRAHEGEPEEVVETVTATLEDTIRSNSLKVAAVGSFLILLFVLLTIILKNKGGLVKKLLYAGIALPTLAATIFLSGSTLYLNLSSSSGGPVHWHADFEVWDCGQKLDLIDPEGFSNRVGSSTFHEHNDDRIHVEGVVVHPEEASLGRFFGFIGGELAENGFELPLNQGMVDRHNGDLCSDGTTGYLQVFVYKTSGKIYTQQKLEDPEDYLLSPYGNVPPGDCIIVEFGEYKDSTDKLCDSYKLQIQKGNLYGN